MKNIHYAGEVLMTGDAIADAVVKYAEKLAQHETSASIEVPVVSEDGVRTEASFLLGPASQIVALPIETEQDDIEDADFLRSVQARQMGWNGRKYKRMRKARWVPKTTFTTSSKQRSSDAPFESVLERAQLRGPNIFRKEIDGIVEMAERVGLLRLTGKLNAKTLVVFTYVPDWP